MGDEKMENNPNKKRSRKKRKNFLCNAKKYAKLGHMGRGTKISEELYQYFVGILDAMKRGIEDEYEKRALVNNVLERTKNDELNIVGNQLGCRVIELLLPYSTPEDFERFLEVLTPDLRKLCSDNFTSHVIEALLKVSCERATEHLQSNENVQDSDTEDDIPNKKKKVLPKVESKYPQQHITNCYNFTIKICKYALNNLEDFVWDHYANHILRVALKCLSGITLLPGETPKVNLFKETAPRINGIPPGQISITYKTVPNEFKEIVVEFANRLSSWPQFKDLPYQNITSGLLQVLLYALNNVDKCLTRNIIKTLLFDSFVPDNWVSSGGDDKDKRDVKIEIDNEDNSQETAVQTCLPPVFQCESAVRLLEICLFLAKKKTYTQIYAKCFINRLGQLALMPMLNFTVQRFIDNCKVKEEFEPIFDELSDKFDALLACKNTGVLVALAKACLRIKSKQMQFVNNLETTLKCTEQANQKYLPVLCLRMLPLDQVDTKKLDKEYFVNVHGSVILQTILDFQRPAKAVNGLLELTSEELLVIFNDAKGCHVADAFCKGQCVGVKARDKLIWKLKGLYQRLALSQYGSRALEQIFEVASPEQKIKIMTELSDKSNLLNSTSYGRLIASKLDIATFKLSQKKWEQTKLKIK